MNKLQAVERKIRELVPRLNCKHCQGRGWNDYESPTRKLTCSSCEGFGWITPIYLEDILEAVYKVKSKELWDWETKSVARESFKCVASYWHFGKPFAEHTELINWLYELFNLSE